MCILRKGHQDAEPYRNQIVSVPDATPLRLTLPREPQWGVESETAVIGVGGFRPTCRGAEDEYSAAVHAYKHGDHQYADEFLNRLQRLVTREFPSADRAVIVPGHDGRQPRHLRELVDDLPVPAPVTLSREPSIPPTKRIADREARWRNVAGTTQVQGTVEGDFVVLVDDVFASGASLGTAAASLRDAGASRVAGAVLGIRRPSSYDITPLETPRRRTN